MLEYSGKFKNKLSEFIHLDYTKRKLFRSRDISYFHFKKSKQSRSRSQFEKQINSALCSEILQLQIAAQSC